MSGCFYCNSKIPLKYHDKNDNAVLVKYKLWKDDRLVEASGYFVQCLKCGELGVEIKKTMKRQRVAGTEIFLNHEKVQVVSTEQSMFMDFVKRVLIPWFHVAKRWRLPKDIAKKIAFEYIPLDFQLHPVHQYLYANHMHVHMLIVHIESPRNHTAFKERELEHHQKKMFKIVDYYDSNRVRRVGRKYGEILVFTMFGDLEKFKHLLPHICPNTKIIKL